MKFATKFVLVASLCLLMTVSISVMPIAAQGDNISDEAYAQYELGVAQYWDGSNDELAVEYLTQALELAPNFADAYAYRGAAYRLVADFASAESDFAQALAIDPDNALAYAWRGRLMFDYQQYQAALTDIDHAIQLNPELIEGYFLRGYLHLQLGNPFAAMEDINHCIELDPEFIRSYLVRAQIYAYQLQYEEAYSEIAAVLEQDPGSFMARWLRSNLRSNTGDYMGAIEDLEYMVEHYPENAIAYKSLAETYSRIGQFDLAEDLLHQAEAIEGMTAELYLSWGYFYGFKGDYIDSAYHVDAINMYKQAIAMLPPGQVNAEIYMSIAYDYDRLGQVDDAIDAYTQALYLRPAFHQAALNRGRLYFRSRQYEDALADFNLAIEIWPEFALAYYYRGLTYRYLRQYDLAIADLDRCIELNPGYGSAYLERARLLYRQYDSSDKMKQAIEDDYNAALQFGADPAQVYSQRAEFYYLTRRHDEALEQNNLALELDPENVDYWTQRINLLTNMRRYEEAYAAATDFIELDPNDATRYGFRLWLYDFAEELNQPPYVDTLRSDCDRVAEFGDDPFPICENN